mgnify:CR=1 FL=1
MARFDEVSHSGLSDLDWVQCAFQHRVEYNVPSLRNAVVDGTAVVSKWKTPFEHGGRIEAAPKRKLSGVTLEFAHLHMPTIFNARTTDRYTN